MPSIIKKQIKKIRKEERFSGYIKLVPLLFFVGFLFVGWLISLTASKFLKTNYGSGGSVIRIPITFAEDDSGDSDSSGDSSGDTDSDSDSDNDVDNNWGDGGSSSCDTNCCWSLYSSNESPNRP